MMLVFLFSFLYASLIFMFFVKWKNLPVFHTSLQHSDIFISVIIAFRNEANNLPVLLSALTEQSYSSENFEIILVNDHSHDSSEQIINAYRNSSRICLKLMALPDLVTGKKAALHAGVHVARGELIVTTDADCAVPPKWLQTIADFYQACNPVMILMPVVLTGNGIVARLQTLEFISLMGSTAASLALNKPLMCNGANLAFEKNAYLHLNSGDLRSDISTGDDTFLMLALFKQFPHRVRFLHSDQVVGKSKAVATFAGFFNQRLRWASKVHAYHQGYIKGFGVFLLCYTGLQAAAMAVIPFTVISSTTKWTCVLLLYGTKMIADGIFIKRVAVNLKQDFDVVAFLCWQFIYPFYVLLFGLSSFFLRYTWKERRYK